MAVREHHARPMVIEPGLDWFICKPSLAIRHQDRERRGLAAGSTTLERKTGTVNATHPTVHQTGDETEKATTTASPGLGLVHASQPQCMSPLPAGTLCGMDESGNPCKGPIERRLLPSFSIVNLLSKSPLEDFLNTFVINLRV